MYIFFLVRKELTLKNYNMDIDGQKREIPWSDIGFVICVAIKNSIVIS